LAAKQVSTQRREPLHTSEPIKARDASQIAVAGCLVGLPIALYAAFKGALKMAENQEHAMAHQVEELDIEVRGDAVASTIPAEETLGRLVASLRRVTAPFEKMGARFEPANYESELKKLENVKKKFETEGKPPTPESSKLLAEVEQLLARYAPQK
jgi:hypothetical protein